MYNKTYLALLVIVGLALGACGGGSLNADAGSDVRVSVGGQIRFDGSGSTGDIVNCRWTILDPPEEMAEDAGKIIRDSASDCAFTLDEEMTRQYIGEWLVELEVTDSAGNADTDTMAIEVIP
jgi:hypothetical protein